MKIELGTVQFKVSIKDGKVVYGSAKLDILQDNTDEVVPLMEDGEYIWIGTLTTDNTERRELSVQPIS